KRVVSKDTFTFFEQCFGMVLDLIIERFLRSALGPDCGVGFDASWLGGAREGDRDKKNHRQGSRHAFHGRTTPSYASTVACRACHPAGYAKEQLSATCGSWVSYVWGKHALSV